MTPIERETLDVDILFVGAGPANLSAAIRLAQYCQANSLEMPMIAVVEKAAEVGGHQVSGAVLDPAPLLTLFPNAIDLGCPREAEVCDEAVYFLRPQSAIKLPLIPPPLKNHGNWVVSLSQLTRWLGERAVELGVNVFTGFTGVETLIENGRVVGIRTGDKGFDQKGQAKDNMEPGVFIKAKCTVFGEGVRGFLSKQLIPQLNLQGRNPSTFETAVKEVWQCKPGTIKPGMVIHTAGFPLSSDTVGGTFVYGMKGDRVALGLVVSLNYENPHLEPYKELLKFKAHPLMARMLEGGQLVAYGAKAISSGGYYAMPRLYFDGGMFVGECAQLLDIARLKGVHIGMQSGILAGERIGEILKAGDDFTAEALKPYQERFLASASGRQLYRARNHHQALSKGMPWALFHLAAQELTNGRGFQDPMPTKLDRAHYRAITEVPAAQNLYPDALSSAPTSADKLTAVYHAGTIHEENQMPHLKIGNFQTCVDTCLPKYAAPCNRFCPAQVYEMVADGDTGKRLQVNFTNCVHCQTCDIKCPEDNIRWTPPESGGGPRYEIL